jgi:hypothetical protein
LACGLFITLGVLLIPLAGLQMDEALFGSPLYVNTDNHLWARLGRLDVPVMLMSYLGSVKSFVYLPIFQSLGVNLWTIRLPMVLAGAATIFVFYKLALGSLGRRAAVFATFLLATDPVFLMTNTFDWGPVALEHLFLVTGCWSLFQFGVQSGTESNPSGPIWHRRSRFLALGCFCFGLALWNKAIFLWALAGVAVAAVLTLWPWVRREINWGNLRIAVVATLLGASPLIYYNSVHPLITFRQNVHLEPEAVVGKWAQVEGSLQGNALFRYIASEEWMEPSKQPGGVVDGASAWIRDRVGPYRNSQFYYVLGALFALVPLWWRSRAAWFSLVFCSVAWLWMALTHDAGGAAHHVVLLWPFPILFAAAVLRRMPKWLILLAGLGIAASNLLVVNQYLFQLQRYGSFGPFTDAIHPLSEALDDAGGDTVYVTDWGIFDCLNLLHQGRLKLMLASGTVATPDPSAAEIAEVGEMFADPKALFVGHVKGRDAYANAAEHFEKLVQAAGFRHEVVRTIADSNGRPQFEILRVSR